jgi:hypothetical protein
MLQRTSGLPCDCGVRFKFYLSVRILARNVERTIQVRDDVRSPGLPEKPISVKSHFHKTLIA